MNISFEKKILLGFIINLIIVGVIGFIFLKTIDIQNGIKSYSTMDLIELGLIVLSLILLIVVYYIITSQLKEKGKFESALFENKQLLQSIIDNTTNAVYIKKLNGEYMLVNKQCASLYGKTINEVLGKTDHDLLPKHIAEGFRKSDLRVAETLSNVKVEEVLQQNDGEHIFLSAKFPLFDSNGRIYAVGGISTDISDRVGAEKTLKETDRFFQLSIDILLVATKEHFIKFNQSLVNVLGYDEIALKQKPFIELIHPEDKETTKTEIGKLSQGVKIINFENRWICKDGSIKWLSWNATTDPSSGMIYAVARDVTIEMSKAEEQQNIVNQLFENEQKLRLILENIAEGVIVADQNKMVVLSNDKANEILGVEPKSYISSDLSDHYDLYFPDGKTIFPAQKSPMDLAYKGFITDDVEIVLIDPQTHEKKRVLISGRPLIDQENRVVAAVLTIKDISKFKQMEEALQIAENQVRNVIGFKKH